MRSTTEDKDLLAVRDEEATELDKSGAEFDSQIAQSDAYFDKQIDATKDWANKQQELQQEQTDFTIEKIEQQKDQAKKDYTKEQSGAYVDWQKQSNQYGANAEKMAAAGMANSGYSESSQVSMYNTYQSRVTAARESYNRAVLNYDNAIKEAQLQNSSILAEIAYNALQKQLELSLQGFQYKNTLVLEKAKARREIQSLYQSKYKDVLNQINAENALEEEKRQFNENKKLQQAQLAEEKRQFDILHPPTPKITSTNKTDASIIAKTETAKANGEKTVNLSSTEKLHLASKKCMSYTDAIQFMANNNIKTGGQRLLTSAEWSKAKRDGQLGSELKYNSYNAYMHAYLEWRIENQ
jgi:hypothetical protein